jgi:hypothetical protein
MAFTSKNPHWTYGRTRVRNKHTIVALFGTARWGACWDESVAAVVCAGAFGIECGAEGRAEGVSS